MNRTGNLIGAIADMDNLHDAFCNARLGKAGKTEVHEFGMRIAGYARYMDDMVLWGDDREGLKRARDAVRQFAAGQLRLDLKEGILLNRSALGLPFLGVRVYPWMRRLTPQSKRRFLGKFAQYEGDLLEQQLVPSVLAHNSPDV